MQLDQNADRARYTQAILDSDAQRRLIVSGPGTGKTYTFQQALRDSDSPGLALTFINNLADDLAQDLGDLADASTFHGYCKRLLHETPVDGLTFDFDYFPPLFEILVDDLAIVDWDVEGSTDEIDAVYQNLAEGTPLLIAALRLGGYYDAVGHTDAVFRVFRKFREDPDYIPSYSLIVVDEYQDFTRLETTFIDLLADVSPVLIAGDDDQALYEFRHASPQYIREAVRDNSFEEFDLPYCSRCTEVVVDAFHDIVSVATERGLLQDRIEKPFTCFLPGKREVSAANPEIIHAECSVERSNAPYMGRYVATQIRDIPQEVIEASHEDSPYPTVLVIGPNPFLRSVYTELNARLDQVQLKKSTGRGLRAADGYRRLIEEENSRLGWRILTYLDPLDGLEDLIAQAINEDQDLHPLLPDKYRECHLRIVGLIQASDRRELSDEELELVGDALGESLEEAFPSDDEDETEDEIDQDIPTVVCTSMAGAKGMSAAYVFIVGMVDDHFPRDPDRPTNSEVRQLLVGLTRTRVCCYLISCRNYAGNWMDESTFISWIDGDRIDYQDIDVERLDELEDVG